MTHEDKLDKNIIRTTYRWATNIENDKELVDYFYCIAAAFRFTETPMAARTIGSQLVGIQKLLQERFEEKEYKNIFANGIIFGEKAVAAFKASQVAEHVLMRVIPGAIERRNSEGPAEPVEELSDEEKAAIIKGDFSQN